MKLHLIDGSDCTPCLYRPMSGRVEKYVLVIELIIGIEFWSINSGFA